MGTIELNFGQSEAIMQGGTVSAEVTGYKQGTRNKVPPNPKVTLKFDGVPAWASVKGHTITVSPTAPPGVTAYVTVTATAYNGAQVVATGSAGTTIEVRGINHLDVTTKGGMADGQDSVLFSPCGIPEAPINLLIGDGVSGSLGVELRDVPDGVTATTAKTVAIGGRKTVLIDVRFKTERASGPDGRFDVVVTPTKGAASTLHVAYKLAPGRIDGVSPNLPATPRFMKAGDTVTLDGQGFCAKSKVTVGNTDAVVDGKASANGLSLKLVMPIDATSGALTVTTTNGAFKKDIKVDSYRNVWGLSFGNSSAFGDMVGDYNVGDFPWGFDFLDPLYLALADHYLRDGQCFGFALTSLRFNDGEISTTSYPGWDGKDASKPGSAFDAWHVRGPALTNGGSTVPAIAEKIHRQHLWQWEGHVMLKWIEQHPTHDNLRSLLKNAFREGPGAVMSIFEWSKGTGHAVVAYDVRDTTDAGPGGFEIDVSDPNVAFVDAGNSVFFKNKPDEDTNPKDHATRLKLSRILVKADDTYTYIDGHGVDLTGSTKHDLTVLSMKVFDSDPDAPDTVLIHEIFGGAMGATVTQVTDASGKKLFGADGTPNRDAATSIKRARALLPIADHQVEPFFVVDAGSKYTITLANGADATYTAAAITNGFVLDLSKTPSQKGATDTVVFDPATGAAEFGSSVAKTFAPRLAARLADKSWHEVTVHTALAANARGRLAFDAKRASVVYTHTGAAATVSFDLGASKDKATTATKLTSAPVKVENGDVITLAPDWDHIDTGAGQLRLRKAGGAETVQKIK
ncbi:MAG TPA: hypothetical protein VGG74_16160 [Kofleriaceae bacterium]